MGWPSPSPGRPQTLKALTIVMTGSPVFLGRIVSAAGLVTNNLSTAVPFNATPRGPTGALETLAGKMLLLQPSVDGFLLASSLDPAQPGFVPLTAQTGALPGPSFLAGERVQMLMGTRDGWLQWLPSGGGAGTLFCWELL